MLLFMAGRETPQRMHTMNKTLRTEFARVFGSVNGDNTAAGLYADGWPCGVHYWSATAIHVLSEYGDDFGATKSGNSKVCAALERAGATMHPDCAAAVARAEAVSAW